MITNRHCNRFASCSWWPLRSTPLRRRARARTWPTLSLSIAALAALPVVVNVNKLTTIIMITTITLTTIMLITMMLALPVRVAAMLPSTSARLLPLESVALTRS